LLIFVVINMCFWGLVGACSIQAESMVHI